MGEQPVFQFGIIADVQYADKDDGQNYRKTRWRYYRQAHVRLEEAISDFSNPSNKVDFILQLGDLIDGFNRRLKTSDEALQKTLSAFDPFVGPVFHTIGNHELYNFKKTYRIESELMRSSTKHANHTPGTCYYYYKQANFYLVVLDTYDFAFIGQEKDSEMYKEAQEFLLIKNPNKDKNSASGLKVEEKRYMEYNGAVGVAQLEWLEGILREAQENNGTVIVAGHQSVYVPSTTPECVCWNADEVLSLLQRYSSCVLCYFSGHDHDGGYAQDEAGIHHLCVPGIIETPMGNDYGIATVYQDRLEIVGKGRVPTLTWKITKCKASVTLTN